MENLSSLCVKISHDWRVTKFPQNRFPRHDLRLWLLSLMDRRNFPEQNEHPGSMLPYEMRSRGFCRQWAGEDTGVKESLHPGRFLSGPRVLWPSLWGRRGVTGRFWTEERLWALRLYLDLRGEGAGGEGEPLGELPVAALWLHFPSPPSPLLSWLFLEPSPKPPLGHFNQAALCLEPFPHQESTALLSHLLQIPGSLWALPDLKPAPPPPPALPALSLSLSFLPTYCQLLHEVQSAGQIAVGLMSQ